MKTGLIYFKLMSKIIFETECFEDIFHSGRYFFSIDWPGLISVLRVRIRNADPDLDADTDPRTVKCF